MSFELMLALVASVLSASALVTGVTRAAAQKAANDAQAQKLRSLRLSEVTEATDLHTLGAIVVHDLGATSVPSYVRDEDVRVRFRVAFNAAREFIGESPEAGRDVSATPGTFGESFIENSRVWPEEELTPSGQRALRDVAEGESWNALARMRRELELVLAARLDSSANGSRRMAAGQLLAVAAKLGAIPAGLESPLRYALSVANRAVHGEDVSADSAVEAVLIIDRFLRSIDHGVDPL